MKKSTATVRDKFAAEVCAVAQSLEKIVLAYVGKEGAKYASSLMLKKCENIINEIKNLDKLDFAIFSETIEEEKQDEV